ncbi:MAG: SUMF1/EgtB/PvdO family nonheme iron enzyme [Bacteroidetes bacterium]|nr:SUMF1/EgtB/PvdO family nonheme iron enzyme [Bacteroidota bacterium]MBU1720263.1 SUMF1/EgtB/PvdO family nonheme iron enzyme [Bacteroidota bacterium]
MKRNFNVLFCFVIILLTSIPVYGQKGLKDAPDTRFVSPKNPDAFLISTKPITNREYLIYLMWISNVYGLDYPESVAKAMPCASYDQQELVFGSEDDDDSPFHTLITNLPAYVREYMFNQKYLDYPVVGISWQQASSFCKWLSDRYNEHTLFVKGYLAPDQYQMNENCFVTESYLKEQYYGARIKEEMVYWNQRLLIPNFHLPSMNELKTAGEEKLLSTDFRAYPFDTTCFLGIWNNWYLKDSAAILGLNYGYGMTEFFSADGKDWDVSAMKCKELTLELNTDNSGASLMDVFNKNGQLPMEYANIEVEKDSSGKMPYIIIDENAKREPIVVGSYSNAIPAAGDNKIVYFFRYSCAMKPGQYKL